jgi:hypothetical protein
MRALLLRQLRVVVGNDIGGDLDNEPLPAGPASTSDEHMPTPLKIDQVYVQLTPDLRIHTVNW